MKLAQMQDEKKLTPYEQAAPQAQQMQQQQGMGSQMLDMAKQRAMSSALDAGTTGLTSALSSSAPVVGSAIEGGAVLGAGTGAGAGAGMAALGTAMPYVGAGLMGAKLLGLFSHGGHIGPMSPMYNADGMRVEDSDFVKKDKYDKSLKAQMKMGRQNKKENEDLIDMIRKGYEFSTYTAPMNAIAAAMGDPIAKRKYGATYNSSGVNVKPDYIDIDNDGNTKESMEEAADSKKKSPLYKAKGTETKEPGITIVLLGPLAEKQ